MPYFRYYSKYSACTAHSCTRVKTLFSFRWDLGRLAYTKTAWDSALTRIHTRLYTHASQRKSFICIPHDYSQVSNDKQQRPACHSSSQLGRPADVRLPHACRLCRRWACFPLMSLLFASQDCTSSPVSPGRVQVIVMGVHSYFSSLTDSGFICIWKAASLCGAKHNETCE